MATRLLARSLCHGSSQARIPRKMWKRFVTKPSKQARDGSRPLNAKMAREEYSIGLCTAHHLSIYLLMQEYPYVSNCQYVHAASIVECSWTGVFFFSSKGYWHCQFAMLIKLSCLAANSASVFIPGWFTIPRYAMTELHFLSFWHSLSWLDVILLA